MKNMKLFAPVFAVLLLCMAVQVSRGDATSLALAGAKYGVKEIQTAGTTHNLTAYTVPGRAAHLRWVWRVTQIPATANNTAVVALNPDGGAAYTLFTLSAATHSQTTIADLTAQRQYQVGSTNITVTNARGVLLRPADVMTLTGSTNSVVRYRVEYVDMPLR